MPSLREQTIKDFGEQWTSYRDNPAYYGSSDLLADIFGPLLHIDTLREATLADIGSGTGRVVNMLLDAGAAHVFAVEPSDAYDVLKSNTLQRANNVTYLKGPGEILPAGLDLDFVVSIGVLHHIPEPRPVLSAMRNALKKGGRAFVWIYGREGNESYLQIAEPIRRVTTRLPHRMLAGLCFTLAIALSLYIWLCRWFPLPMRTYMRSVLAKFSFEVRQLTIYDQLNPAFAKYYREEEARALLEANGFVDVRLFHRHGYSWSVIGTKPDD
jgi:SAM-dependent methyltransferase